MQRWFFILWAFSAGVMVAVGLITILGGLQSDKIHEKSKYAALMLSGAVFAWGAGKLIGSW